VGKRPTIVGRTRRRQKDRQDAPGLKPTIKTRESGARDRMKRWPFLVDSSDGLFRTSPAPLARRLSSTPSVDLFSSRVRLRFGGRRLREFVVE
jgi:hypothetical protein